MKVVVYFFFIFSSCLSSVSSSISPITNEITKIPMNKESASRIQTSNSLKKSENLDSIQKMSRGGNNNEVWADMLERLRISSYFALWYLLNVIYNIVNKKVLNVIPSPISIGSIQLGTGSLYCILLWFLRLRARPSLTAKGKNLIKSVGFYHSSGQLLSMVSLGAGPVSFTHIVKALEPFFSACVSALVFGKWMKWQVYSTLLPVVGGVSYACLKERGFSWLSFYCAMGSNLAFALRATISKMIMQGDVGSNLSSPNIFGLVTIWAFLFSIPLTYFIEGFSFIQLFKDTMNDDSIQSEKLLFAIASSGLLHYLNNEVMYLALSNVHPVTLAVGNTMKRVFIILASVIVFRNPVSLQTAIGSAIGIGGVLLYSLTKQYYEKLETINTLPSNKRKGK